MSYKNAKDFLPPNLLAEVQKYAGGTLLYIPTGSQPRVPWGALPGTRQELADRNRAIRSDFSDGCDMREISAKYCLSEESVKKIIYNKTAAERISE